MKTKLTAPNLSKAACRLNSAFGTTGHRSRNPIADYIISDLTAGQLSQLISEAPEEIADKVFLYLWTFHISWAFEMTWATILEYPEELENMEQEVKDNCKIPENFDPNTPLKELPKWALHDRI